MVYLDTSFLIPYYLEEATSQAVDSILQKASSAGLAISPWVTVEFASALARRVRMGALPASIATVHADALEHDATHHFYMLELDRADYALARAMVLNNPDQGLRGPDALHLAVAARYTIPIYSLDRQLIQAATALDLSATDAGILGAG